MTDSIRELRGRRAPRFEDVPPELAAWFAGLSAESWYSLLPYERELLPARWRSYKVTHPDAVPPEGYAWLEDPDDPRQPSPEQIREARKMLARDLMR